VKIVFHPRVFSEIDAIMRYYEDVADPELLMISTSSSAPAQFELPNNLNP